MPTDASTLLLLVRHGQTPTTGRVLPGRAPGLHLSDAGRQQAQAVAERLDGLAVDALYTSPLERARETAEPTERLTGLTATPDDGLLECDFGEWTGAELVELAKLPQWRAVQLQPSGFRFPGGESFRELQDRLVDAAQRLRAAQPGRVVVCFSHADPIKALLTHALGAPLDHFQRLHVEVGSVSVLDWPAQGDPVVRAVNLGPSRLADLRTG